MRWLYLAGVLLSVGAGAQSAALTGNDWWQITGVFAALLNLALFVVEMEKRYD